MSLYLFPGTCRNIELTVEYTVPYEKLQRYLPKSVIMELRQKMNCSEPNCWAVSKECKIDYTSIRENDAVLFKKNEDDRFCHLGYVAYRYKSDSLGMALWCGSWEKLLFIKDTQKVCIPIDRLRDALGYNDHFWFPGATKVDDERLFRAICEHKTYDKFIKYLETGKTDQKTFITKKRTTTNEPLIPSVVSAPDDDDEWKI